MTVRTIGFGLTLAVRRVDPDDASLGALSKLAVEELHSTSTEATPPRGSEAYHWLVDLATRTEGAAASGILASLNGGSVGMGIVVHCGDSALLHGVFVAPTFRGIGIGRSIVEEARIAAGNSTLRTLALPGDRRTKNLFEQAGMPAQLIVAG